MIRRNEVYVIATVNKKVTSFALRVKEPTSLLPNQFAFKLKMEIDENKWFKRITEVKLGEITPPVPDVNVPDDSIDIGLTTAENVLNRMTGE